MFASVWAPVFLAVHFLPIFYAQLNAFNSFGDLLIDRNRHVNLTAIKEERDIIIKHFIDSLSLAIYIPELAKLLNNTLPSATLMPLVATTCP